MFRVTIMGVIVFLPTVVAISDFKLGSYDFSFRERTKTKNC
jgi:hypothetical protein